MPNLSYFLKWVAQHGTEAGFCAKTGKVVLFASLLATSQPSDGSNFEDDNKADNDDNYDDDGDDDWVIVKSLIFLKILHNLLTELHWSKIEVNEAKFLANATARHLLPPPPLHFLLLVLFFLQFLLILLLLLFLLNC